MFDRKRIENVMIGKSVLSYSAHVKLFAACLQRIDELTAENDELLQAIAFLEEGREDEDMPTLLKEGYINDSDTV